MYLPFQVENHAGNLSSADNSLIILSLISLSLPASLSFFLPETVSGCHLEAVIILRGTAIYVAIFRIKVLVYV